MRKPRLKTGAFAFRIPGFPAKLLQKVHTSLIIKNAYRQVVNVLAAGVCLAALQAQAGEALATEPKTSAAEHCLKALGMDQIQPFRDMAKELSPEIVLDRVFSSVAPDFQKALLSRPEEPGKPIKKPEAMRDPKYMLPAIATVPLSSPWVNVTSDGRVVESSHATGTGRADSSWTRVKETGSGTQPAKQGPLFPFFAPAPQRY